MSYLLLWFSLLAITLQRKLNLIKRIALWQSNYIADEEYWNVRDSIVPRNILNFLEIKSYSENTRRLLAYSFTHFLFRKIGKYTEIWWKLDVFFIKFKGNKDELNQYSVRKLEGFNNPIKKTIIWRLGNFLCCFLFCSV